MSRIRCVFAALLLSALVADSTSAQVHPLVPAMSSRPGAPYTLYLNFGGFDFNGTWGGGTPGSTPAYGLDGNPNAFSTTELSLMRSIFTRAAEKYSPFNVNVTTVDPAVAANQAASDAQRQAYYDSQPRMMQTVVGGSGAWYPNAGGVSNLGVAATAAPNTGRHTNWVFAGQSPTSTKYLGEAIAHENGHALILSHQSDYNGNTLVNEYSSGTGTGAGSVAPIMGTPQAAERALWRVGTAHVFEGGPFMQNDARGIVNRAGMGGYYNAGVGRTLQTATPLPLSGVDVDFNLAKGVITPVDVAQPNPTGVNNYTSDFWRFDTGAGNVSLTINSGRSTLTPGLADPGAMLDSSLALLDAQGNIFASRITTAFSESLSVSLSAGTYYLKVSSAGDPLGRGYFDMGSYFVTGRLIAVPEPATLLLMAFGLAALVWRGRSARKLSRSK